MASAIRSLRIGAFLSEVPKTDIARSTGISRGTIAKRLKSKDMSLSDFVSIAMTTNQDPAELLRNAQDKANEKSPQGSAAGNEAK